MSAAALRASGLVRWGYTVFARDRVSVKRVLVWSTAWPRSTARRAAQDALRAGALEAWIVVGRWTEEDGWSFGRAEARLRDPRHPQERRWRRAHMRLV